MRTARLRQTQTEAPQSDAGNHVVEWCVNFVCPASWSGYCLPVLSQLIEPNQQEQQRQRAEQADIPALANLEHADQPLPNLRPSSNIIHLDAGCPLSSASGGPAAAGTSTQWSAAAARRWSLSAEQTWGPQRIQQLLSAPQGALH